MKAETKALLAAILLISVFVAGTVVGQRTGAARQAAEARRNWCAGFEAAQSMLPDAKGDFLGYGCVEPTR